MVAGRENEATAVKERAGPDGPGGADATEVAVVVRAAGGDPQAFTELHGRYLRLVDSVVRAELRRGATTADRDDVVQEVFTLAWQRLGQIKDPARFRPWLLQIARRAVIDHARRAGRRPALDGDDELALDQQADGRAGPDELAELAELAGRLRSSIDGLSRRDATAITLAVQFGFGPAEIAEALDITPNNAKVVLHRARSRLRAAVA